MRYFLCLSYDGSAFCGWQIQPSAPSVQQCLESTLSRLLGRPVAVTGAGRTDTAVNAANYVAHFDWDGILPFEVSDFTYKLNAMLPREVVVHSVSEVADDLHARFSAKRREYTYFIHRQKDPFLRAYSWQCGYPHLDFEAMNRACQYLLGTHDFSCFEKTGTDNKTSICTVYDAYWKPYVPSHIQIMSVLPSSGNYWYFRIAADRFLRNMVRATVGTLIEVGRGKHDPEWVAELIKNGSRGDAGESVPGNALFLNKVQY
jgi:tRNA pseudouridine38-40 synthase